MTIKVRLLDGGRKIQLMEDLVVDGHLRFVVPEGFVCDYASVPRPLWSLIPPMGNRYTGAAILHDWMYSHHMVYTSARPQAELVLMNVDKKTADLIFRGAMVNAKVRKWRIHAMYWAVRLFGANAWVGSFQDNKKP